MLLREEVSQLQDEVHLLRQMKEMLAKDLEESHDSRSAEVLSVTELKVQLVQKEQELARAKEALQGKLSYGLLMENHLNYFTTKRRGPCSNGSTIYDREPLLLSPGGRNVLEV